MSNIQNEKIKLKTVLEKNIQRLVSQHIREHIVDFTVLYVRKNGLKIDSAVLDQIIKVVQQGIDDSYYKNIDGILNKMDKDIEKFIQTTNPLATTVSDEEKPGAKKPTAKK